MEWMKTNLNNNENGKEMKKEKKTEQRTIITLFFFVSTERSNYFWSFSKELAHCLKRRKNWQLSHTSASTYVSWIGTMFTSIDGIFMYAVANLKQKASILLKNCHNSEG